MFIFRLNMSKDMLHIQNRQTETLQCILLSQLKNTLIKVTNFLKNRKCPTARQQLRNYLQNLPVSVRSELLNMVLCPYRNFGGMSYQFTTGEESFNTCLLCLDSLLSPGVDRIYCCRQEWKGNFNKILQCLLQNTNKLKILFLPLASYIYGLNKTKYRALLSELLIKNSSWLTNLQLGSGCNDQMMHIIGENCHCLQNLDIQMSTVSDDGIRVLTQIWECHEGRELANDDDKVDESLTISQRATRSLTKPCNEIQNRKHRCRYLCYKTKVCHSLRRINLQYTDVTEKGIHILLSTVSNLQDIGICMTEVLGALYKSYEENSEGFQSPNWNLRSLFMLVPTPQHLTMITKLTTKNIKNLKIQSIPATTAHGFQKYLECYGSNLTSLALSPFGWTEVVDLSSFLKYCPNLISLKLNFARLSWCDDMKPVPSPTLKFAQLMFQTSCESAILFMESVSALKEVYFSSVEEDEKFLKVLCKKSISKELKVLYLNYPNFQNNPGLVSEFWQCHKQIEFIGRIAFDLSELRLGSAVGLTLINTKFLYT